MITFTRVFKKAFWVLFAVGAISFFALAGLNAGMIASAKPHILTLDQATAQRGYDCVLVLGAQIYSPTTLSPMLEDRVKYGIECYAKGAAPILLLSGDHGYDDHDEVNAMKSYCIDKGVSPDVIFLDHAGFSTYESMYRARDIFGAKRVLIVTQKFHLSRAVYIACSLGLDADGVASDPRDYGSWAYNNTREFLARVKAAAFCVIKPPPTYLGEKIPLTGPASTSDDRVYTNAGSPPKSFRDILTGLA
ncbi:MAG: YdcF family protein [Oscillospiraceae bacterium]|jgi:vancomycin permeability regulator SanA|nr:YdcF family protein [Oscillospiraceae bacterium]